MRPLLSVIVLSSMLLVGGVMFLEESFIFFPTRYPTGNWSAPEHGPCQPEDVSLSASDGTRLHGWYFSSAADAPTILFFHGNAGNLSDRYQWSCSLSGLPANVLSVDYRGYGRSEGRPTEAGLYLDAEAAYRYLREERGVAPQDLIVYGKSLGGAAACELAQRFEMGALVLQSTFTTAADMARLMMPMIPSALLRTRFDNLDKVSRVEVQKLIIHSRADEMIPFWMAEKLYEAAPEPKTMAAFEAAGHNDLIWRHAEGVLRAFRTLLLELGEGGR